MDLRAKLQIPPGTRVHVINAPAGLEKIPSSQKIEEGESGAVLLFARNSSILKANRGLVVKAAKMDRLAWIAYPKAEQLETDLNRDKLRRSLQPMGIQPVRQVSIDDTWSALRFRPAR